MRQSGPEILPPGRKNSGPEKEIPGPGIFFPGPEIFSRRFRSPFFRYLELFHRQIPDVNMSAQAPPGLRAPAIPARKQPAPATKRKPAPSICRHWDFRTFRETAFLAPASAPCPVQVNLRGFQMTKCQIPGQMTKCQIRRSVSAGKHETVPFIFLLLRNFYNTDLIIGCSLGDFVCGFVARLAAKCYLCMNFERKQKERCRKYPFAVRKCRSRLSVSWLRWLLKQKAGEYMYII